MTAANDRALRRAVGAKDAKAVAKALAAGANPYTEDAEEGGSLAMKAAERGDRAVVEAFLDGGYDIDAVDGGIAWSLLMAAAVSDQARVIGALIARGADVHYRGPRDAASDGDSALTLACGSGFGTPSPRAVRALLEHGADPNLARRDGWTPLMLVAHAGDVKLAGALLDAGADPGAKHPRGWRAIDVAKEHGREQVVALLRDARPVATKRRARVAEKKRPPPKHVNNEHAQWRLLLPELARLLAAVRHVGGEAPNAEAVAKMFERVIPEIPALPKRTRGRAPTMAPAEGDPTWKLAAAWPLTADGFARAVREHRASTRGLAWLRWRFDGFACNSRADGTWSHAVFDRRDLRGLSFADLVLAGAQFAGALADGVDFSGATLERALLAVIHAPAARFDGAKLRGVDFSQSVLRGASFRGADLRGADFQDCDLAGCDFADALTTGAKHLPAREKR